MSDANGGLQKWGGIVGLVGGILAIAAVLYGFGVTMTNVRNRLDSLEHHVGKQNGGFEKGAIYKAVESLRARKGISEEELEKKLAPLMAAPAGTIAAWPLSSPPQGWLICDGTAKPRDGAFKALSSVMEKEGFPWGPGDGSTTFNLPDFRGLFLRGADDPDGDGPLPEALRDEGPRLALDWESKSRGFIASVQFGATQKPTALRNPSRNGSYLLGEWRTVAAPGNSSNGIPVIRPLEDGGSDGTFFDFAFDSETRPKNACVNFIIKY